MMSSASRRTAPRSVQVLFVVWMVFSGLDVARASRSLHQSLSSFGTCVVLGASQLRRCGLGCDCPGKSSDRTCFCRGECDATYKDCDGNKNIQAKCDCSASSREEALSALGAGANAGANAVKAGAAAVNEAIAPPPPPQKAPAPTPVTRAAPVQTNPTGLVQRVATPLYTIGGGNPVTGGNPIGLSLANGQVGIGPVGFPIIG